MKKTLDNLLYTGISICGFILIILIFILSLIFTEREVVIPVSNNSNKKLEPEHKIIYDTVRVVIEKSKPLKKERSKPKEKDSVPDRDRITEDSI
jgi:hypothetical protein